MWVIYTIGVEDHGVDSYAANFFVDFGVVLRCSDGGAGEFADYGED
jgi:hypothetical protein